VRRTQRINVRLSPEALNTLREAADSQQQDLTSFVLGAALDRARGVLVEERLLRLTPHEVQQLEASLDRDPEVNTVLATRLARVGARLASGDAEGERATTG
jgi:uncharacterized protein (DUF1778 family)